VKEKKSKFELTLEKHLKQPSKETPKWNSKLRMHSQSLSNLLKIWKQKKNKTRN